MHLLIVLLLTITLFGCSRVNLARPSNPFGNFRLGHVTVHGADITKGSFSLEATDDEIKGALYVALQ